MGTLGTKLAALVMIVGVVLGAVIGVIIGAAVVSNKSTTTIIYRNNQPADLSSVNHVVVPVTSDVGVVKRAGPAVVSILHTIASHYDGYGGVTPGSSALGSGFIVDHNGDIVTNNHVISGGNPHYTVTFSDGKKVPATLVGANATYDIAVIHVNAQVPAVVPWADSAYIQVGEPVVALGDPLGQFPNTATSGIVSGLHRILAGTCSGSGASCPEDYIQTDAAINHGNSGGPLLDRDGQVIGINTAIQRSTGQTNSSGPFSFGDPFQSQDPNSTVAEGLGFAIPADTARPIANHLINHTPLPFLGVCYRPVTQLAETRGIPAGARIETGCGSGPAVSSGSPAAKAGLKANDVIVAVGSKRLTNNLSLIEAVLPNNAGQIVSVKIWRPDSANSTTGHNLTLSVTLAKS